MALSHIFLSLILISFCDSLSGHEKTTPSSLDFLRNITPTHKLGQHQKGLRVLKNYLTHLGYMQPIKQKNDVFDRTLESAIKKYQKFYRLNITGTLDQPTIASLTKPRCGVPDFPNSSFTSLYTFAGSTWPPEKRTLTFSYLTSIPDYARVPISEAIFTWQKFSSFRFSYIEDVQKADVKISFERGEHGDEFPLDGPGNFLAHAFYPTDGRLHLDGDEAWTTGTNTWTYDLFSVALHEMGHILGLGHSQDRKASMYATFDIGEERSLNEDDIRAIQTLYPQ